MGGVRWRLAAIACLAAVTGCGRCERLTRPPQGGHHGQARKARTVENYWWARDSRAMYVEASGPNETRVWEVPVGRAEVGLVFESAARCPDAWDGPLWARGSLQGLLRTTTIVRAGHGLSQTAVLLRPNGQVVSVVAGKGGDVFQDGTLIILEFQDDSGSGRRLRHVSVRGRDLDPPTAALDPWVVSRIRPQPRGRRLAMSMLRFTGKARVSDLFAVEWGAEPRPLTHLGTVDPERWTWLPDGERIRFLSENSRGAGPIEYDGIWDVELLSGRLTGVVDRERLEAIDLHGGSWLPSGEGLVWIAGPADRSVLRALSLPDGQLRSFRVAQGAFCLRPSPDGRYIAYETTGGPAIRVFDLTRGRDVWVVECGDGAVRMIEVRGPERGGDDP